MSVSLLSRNVARKLLFIQLLAVMASGLLFSLKDPFWGISAVCGGLAVVLPNLMFIIFAWRHQAHTPAKGRVAWTFAFGEAFKVSVAANHQVLRPAFQAYSTTEAKNKAMDNNSDTAHPH